MAPALAASLASLAALPVPGTAAGSCGHAVQITVELGGRARASKTVAARASAGKRRDADRLQLVCERAS